MKTPSFFRLGFGLGMSLCALLLALYQDMIGKTEYLRQVQAGWIEGRYTLPIEIVLLLIVVWLIRWGFKKEKWYQSYLFHWSKRSTE